MCASNQSICLEKNRLGWLKFLEESLPLSLRRRSRNCLRRRCCERRDARPITVKTNFSKKLLSEFSTQWNSEDKWGCHEKSWGFWQPRWVWDSSLLLFVRNSLYQFRKSGQNWRDFWKVSTKHANFSYALFRSVHQNLKKLIAKICMNQTAWSPW